MARLYDTAEWKRLRLNQLQREPFCRYCKQLGIRTPATVVDHVIPHKGNRTLFFDPQNLQSLCKCCHDGAKQQLEQSGHLKGGDARGWPVDPNHWWNKQP